MKKTLKLIIATLLVASSTIYFPTIPTISANSVASSPTHTVTVFKWKYIYNSSVHNVTSGSGAGVFARANINRTGLGNYPTGYFGVNYKNQIFRSSKNIYLLESLLKP